MPTGMGIFAGFLVYYTTQAIHRSTKTQLARRTSRLLRPFLVWFVVYAARRAADSYVDGSNQWQTMVDWLPPNGTMHQLWFLPWSFITSMALFYILRHWQGIGFYGLGLAAIAVSVAVFLIIGQDLLANDILVWIVYFPAFLAGAVLALAEDGARRQMMVLATSVALGAVFFRTAGIQVQQLIIAVPLMVLALRIGPNIGSGRRLLSEISVHIFLLHVAMIAILVRVTNWSFGDEELAVMATLLSVVAGLGLRATVVNKYVF